MFCFHSRIGDVHIIRIGAHWQARLNGVVLNEFTSPEEAAAAVAGSPYMPALRHLLAGLNIPADLRLWTQADLQLAREAPAKREHNPDKQRR